MTQTLIPPPRKNRSREVVPFEAYEAFNPFGMSVRRLFDDLWARPFAEENGRMFAPPTEIAEDADSFTVSAELPGIPKEDVHVQFEDGLLTFTGEKKFTEEKKGRNFHRMERRYGSFFRSVPLPVGVDVNLAHARFDNGVLEIRLPKRADVKPRTLPIQ